MVLASTSRPPPPGTWLWAEKETGVKESAQHAHRNGGVGPWSSLPEDPGTEILFPGLFSHFRSSAFFLASKNFLVRDYKSPLLLKPIEKLFFVVIWTSSYKE